MLRHHPRNCLIVVLLFALVGCANQPSPTSVPQTSIETPGSPLVGVTSTIEASSPASAMVKTRVTFTSDNLTLEGFLYKPSGDGPFPAIVWNHGNEQNPDSSPELGAVAKIFVPAGYIVFVPVRRGQGGSQGESVQNQMQKVLNAQGTSAAQQLFVQQMEVSQLDDQLAGLTYLKSLSYVDPNRLVVAGCADGGIQALFAAEKSTGYKAAIAISPASDGWDSNQPLQKSLIKAVSDINIPVFLIHPEKDTSVAPGYALAQEFLRLNKPYGLKIYPPFGPEDEQGECFGNGNGFNSWANDGLSFLADVLSPKPTGATQPPLMSPTSPLKPEQITLKSDGLNLVGYVYKPKGPGPFPGIIWNHGSEQNPTPASEFNNIASVFVPAGYVVVDPVRRGQGGSGGPYIDDQYKQMVQSKGAAAANQFLVQQFQGPQLDDELAGLAHLKSLPYVDKNRLAVVGCSYGGMMTLLGAESGAGYKAAVAMSPGAESWRNPAIQQMLTNAVKGVNIPVLMMHPAHDASLEPGFTLGPQFQKSGKSYGLQIFPPFGGAVEHCFGGGTAGEGKEVWGPDALSFLSEVLH